MLGWILGIIGFIMALCLILKVLNRKPSYQVTRMPSLEEKSIWDKVKDACCTRKS